MFGKFKELLSSNNLLDGAYETTVRMLEFDHTMFLDSQRTLRGSDSTKLPYDFKKADIRINKFEREVRRNLLTHLVVAGSQNLVAGLVLATIVIDVERIGDYTKNIAELTQMNANRLNSGQFEDEIAKIEAKIERQFPVVIEVLRSNDVDTARTVLDEEPVVARAADAIITDIVTCEAATESACQAVRISLYTRYLKRINAHLSNIASSIVNPFPRIGFREKKSKADR